MATSNILRIAEVDASQVTLSTPKSLDNGGKMISLYHKGKPLIMQIPTMDSPYGVSRYPSDKGGDDKLSIDLSFRDMQNNPNLKDLYDLIAKLDNLIIEEGFKNGMAWFKKKFATKDVVEALYTPMVKHAKDKETGEITDKYPPTLKINIPYRDGKYACETYDSSRQQVSLDNVDLKGAAVTAIIQCNGVWVAGGKFGCKFRVLQMKVAPRANKITGYAFLEDDDRIVEA